MSLTRLTTLRLLTIVLISMMSTVLYAQTELSLFIVQQDRLIDVSRHIEWLRCPLGQKWVISSCRGTALALTYDDAAQAIHIIDPHVTDHWRIPNRDELLTLKCTTCQSESLVPALNTIARGVYWTSDENLWVPGNYWTVNMNNFNLFGRNPANARHYILLVRDKDIPTLPHVDGKDGLLTK